ncbi:MAG: YdeI/OmpD-associated family protein [Anaerolineaceae bacterium]|nr:YdeI/OmpD-associated family protein [Anaerolineaceae bacterium]
MKQLYVETLAAWRSWLKKNHDLSQSVWLVFYKKETGKPSLSYQEAVEEALCYGWIDSIIKKIDDESYLRKFTPRKDDSKWSTLNKKRVEKMMREKRMTQYGLAKVEIAKQNGVWDKPEELRPQFVMHEDFQAALDQHPKALEFFNSLNKADRQQYIYWVASAKREETRQKRIKESLELLQKGQGLGLK